MAFMVWEFRVGRGGCYAEGVPDDADTLSPTGEEFDTREEASAFARASAEAGSPWSRSYDDVTFLVIEGFRRKRPL